ncbi:hypothetical protein MUA04_24165 [Enterobacteriaceae bacterium H11S18]|uniref:glycine-rich domain-containing protein n=1 Tax=Dryocola clanedunensis TaxID=2925396 RepID=UPI0022F03C89|nr:hypothetical protein [Dryocola clanedunensis]MCT4713268.1 hypothetical protein [Dryocola clanedunensis]
MAKNDIKAFAIGESANVMAQAEWEGLDALENGFVSGKASSAQVNKALRQSTFVAAALAQSVADISGEDVLDDGDVAGLVGRLTTSNQGRLLGVQRFTVAGSYTYTPTPGTSSIVVEVIGAGGGGGCSIVNPGGDTGYVGAGGGAGGYASGRLTDVPASLALVVGAGGAGGVSLAQGERGGDSSFGDMTATGGGPAGFNASLACGGEGGTGAGGDLFNARGGSGGDMNEHTGVLNATPGAGGASRYDGGSRGAPGATGAGVSGLYGSGGSGALSFDAEYAGGSGGDGLVVVWEYS